MSYVHGTTLSNVNIQLTVTGLVDGPARLQFFENSSQLGKSAKSRHIILIKRMEYDCNHMIARIVF